MNIISDQKKCMASLAVFKQLFNSSSDIFDVIAEFVRQAIVENGLAVFTEQQMHDLLLQDNGFDVPQAVIQTSIKRLAYLKRQKDAIIVSSDGFNQADCSDLKKQLEEATEKREDIARRLIAFANSKREMALSKDEETELCRCFYSCVIDENVSSDFTELACAFILANENDSELQKHLKLVKEGVISFVGLTYYNNSCGTVDTFDRKIYIYLETEILFHMAGYNGQTYQNLFEEFYAQVKEINLQNQKKSGKKVIYLRYFDETKREIDDYFLQAEKIVRRQYSQDPSKSAMHTLLKGVQQPSDIADKRTQFNKLLEEHCIVYENYSYDLTTNPEACIDYSGFSDVEDPSSEDKQYVDLQMLNWIFIKRGKRDVYSLSNMGSVLLTGNRRVMKKATDLCKPKTIALSCTLDFLTVRFWFSLCRGLSKDCNLLSANVLTKARLALATLNVESIGKAYADVIEEYKNGHYDKESVKSRIATLHRRFRMPENVDDLVETNQLAFFSDNRSDILLAEEAAKDMAFQQTINGLNEEIKAKDKKIRQNEVLAERVMIDRLAQINEEERAMYNHNMANYNAKKDAWVDEKMKRMKYESCFIITAIVFIALVATILPFIIPRFSWEIGLLLCGFLAIFDWMKSSLREKTNRALHYLLESYRRNLRKGFETDYFVKHPKPELKHTTMEELKEKYNNPNL